MSYKLTEEHKKSIRIGMLKVIKKTGTYIKCEICKKEFYVHPSETDRRFCFVKCYKIWAKENKDNVGVNSPAWKGGKPHCKECGKETTYGFDRCQECYLKGMKGKNAPNWQGGKVELICKQCGKKFKAYPSLDRQFCSHRCGETYYSGERSHFYYNGLSYEVYPKEFSKELKEEAREFWGRKCQHPDCGIPEQECLRKLDVHHIDYNKKNCSIVNLIPLCNKHNVAVNFNRKHWEEYFTQLYINRIPEIIRRQNK